MFYISHRGNLDGPNIEKENSPDYIVSALNKGYDVEIDVWYIDNTILLGHDKPEHVVNLSFLKNDRLWCHAKNVYALDFMLKNNVHCFWHQEDEYSITSKNIIIAYPGYAKNLPGACINIMPEILDDNFIKKKYELGVCSDYIKLIKEHSQHE
tara:strand:+ start:105 stop:563 length:459 start_codon:yes stop_codon:yes gene_type:complete